MTIGKSTRKGTRRTVRQRTLLAILRCIFLLLACGNCCSVCFASASPTTPPRTTTAFKLSAWPIKLRLGLPIMTSPDLSPRWSEDYIALESSDSDDVLGTPMSSPTPPPATISRAFLDGESVSDSDDDNSAGGPKYGEHGRSGNHHNQPGRTGPPAGEASLFHSANTAEPADVWIPALADVISRMVLPCSSAFRGEGAARPPTHRTPRAIFPCICSSSFLFLSAFAVTAALLQSPRSWRDEADPLCVYRKMFIGGLNWETTDRTFFSNASIPGSLGIAVLM